MKKKKKEEGGGEENGKERKEGKKEERKRIAYYCTLPCRRNCINKCWIILCSCYPSHHFQGSVKPSLSTARVSKKINEEVIKKLDVSLSGFICLYFSTSNKTN